MSITLDSILAVSLATRSYRAGTTIYGAPSLSCLATHNANPLTCHTSSDALSGTRCAAHRPRRMNTVLWAPTCRRSEIHARTQGNGTRTPSVSRSPVKHAAHLAKLGHVFLWRKHNRHTIRDFDVHLAGVFDYAVLDVNQCYHTHPHPPAIRRRTFESCSGLPRAGCRRPCDPCHDFDVTGPTEKRRQWRRSNVLPCRWSAGTGSGGEKKMRAHKGPRTHDNNITHFCPFVCRKRKFRKFRKRYTSKMRAFMRSMPLSMYDRTVRSDLPMMRPISAWPYFDGP